MITNKLFNGFNNGRDTTEGVGGLPPFFHHEILIVHRDAYNMQTNDFIEEECRVKRAEERLKRFKIKYG